MLPEDNFTLERTGFYSIEKIGKFVLILIQRCWRACSAGILCLLLLYWLYGGVVIFLLLVSAVVGAFYHYQDALLFFPDQPESSRVYVQSPQALGIPYENHYIKTQDGVKINVIFLKQQKVETAPTAIFFHGNAGNVGHRLLNAHNLYSYCGLNVLLVEYRGYGKSEGSPSELGLQLDAEASLNFLLNRQDIDHGKILIYGRSLGGAVSIYLASHEEYAGHIFALIVENTFTSIPAMGKHMFPWLRKLPDVCHRNQFPSIDRIRQTVVPTLFLSGLADQLVPPKMMVELSEASSSSYKKVEVFPTGTHNDTWQCYGYLEALNRFIAEVSDAKRKGLIPTKVTKRAASRSENHRIGMPKDV